MIAGKYRLSRVLGKGGMGVVYEATNESLGRRVALKRLWPGAVDDPDLVSRLEREARATASIQSPHVVEILDVVRDDHDELWVVMELLEGESLAARIARGGALAVEETVPVMLQALTGLAAAHGRQIVHRDLKPANIFLHRRPDGGTVVKLLDFGISRFLGEESEASRLTATGAMLGTPSYMAPEQARSSRLADERSDIYSVGATLYDCLTGQPPYGRDTYPVILGKLMTEDPVDLADLAPETPSWVIDLVRRAMARDPADRFPSAEAMRLVLEASVDLAEVRTVPSTSRRPATSDATSEAGPTPYAGESARRPGPRRRHGPLIAAGTLVAVVVAAGALAYLSSRPPRTPALLPSPPPSLLPLSSLGPRLTVTAPSPGSPLLTPAPAPSAGVRASQTLRVTVRPEGAGARVTVALASGVELARTDNPALFRVPEDDRALRLEVRADGYRDVTRVLDGVAEQVEVTLERRHRTRTKHAPTIDDSNPLRR